MHLIQNESNDSKLSVKISVNSVRLDEMKAKESGVPPGPSQPLIQWME